MTFKKNEKKFSGDKWGSTFKHIMLLDDTHPKNRRSEMTGYSKDLYIPEPLDKEYLLLKQVRVCMEWIQDGRCLSATFMKRPDKTFWWNHAHPILVLYRPARLPSDKDYQIQSYEDVPEPVEKEIKDLYQLLKDGKLIEDAPRRGSRHQGKAFETTLERHLAYGTFKSSDSLKEYCGNKRKEGYEYGLLMDFYKKYESIWFKK